MLGYKFVYRDMNVCKVEVKKKKRIRFAFFFFFFFFPLPSVGPQKLCFFFFFGSLNKVLNEKKKKDLCRPRIET